MPRRPRLAALLAALVVLAALPVGVRGAGDATPLYPDLAMEPPVWTFPGFGSGVPFGETPPVCGTPAGGFVATAWQEPCPPESEDDRWLRFGSFLINIGPGPLRLVATRPDTGTAVMSARQRVQRTDGRWRTVTSGATARWAEEQDGHPHWHTDTMERYRLFPTSAAGATPLGAKIGFCFFDGYKVRPAWKKGVPRMPAYGFLSCQGDEFREEAAMGILSMTVGMSRGWGDLYPWNYAGQRIDIAGLPDGEYLLCLTADPLDVVRESNETNNESWSRIAITTVADPFRVNVEILESGRSSCAGQLPYPISPLGAGSLAARVTHDRDRPGGGSPDGHRH